MTVHRSYLPFSLDPLMAEAKRRMRRRRALLSAAGLVGVASAVALFLALGGGGSSNGQSRGAAGTRGAASPAVGQLASLTVDRPAYFIHGFGGLRKPPGGAALRQKHKLIAHSTVVGPMAIWVAPDWAVRGTCAWLTVGRVVDGGECRRSPPPRGLWEVVPIRLGIRARSLTLLWGHAGRDVASLAVRFQDGTMTRLPLTDGVFFHVFSRQRWLVGHRPALVIARETDGRTQRVRLLNNPHTP